MSEQFENSIRKKLEEADVPFDPAAWDDMKKRLDDSDRRRPVFWWWASGLLLLLLLGGGGWWWYAQQDKTTALQNVPIEKTTEPQALPTPGSSEKAENTGTPTAENNGTPNTNSGNATSTPSEKINIAEGINTQGKVPTAANNIKPTPGKAGADNSITPKNSARQNQLTQNQKAQNAATQNQLTKDPAAQSQKTQNAVTQNPVTQNQNTQITTETPKSNTTNEPAKKEPGIQSTPLPFNQLQKTTEPIVNNAPVTDKPTQQIPDTTANTYTNVDKPKDSTQPKKKKRGFDGGITLGPDYNIASSFRMGKLGFGAGLLLRYHVNNRLNLSVGAVYTKKVYGATPKDYKFPYPTNYVKIDADCDVLDVPLNVNYTFLDQKKGTWSAMAGASSYFMLKEKYDYYWANNNKNTRKFSNENQHYFSVLNLGVTYERKTPGRLKWGLQPYVKVPLGGVGQGKVKLNSAGVKLQLMLGKKD